MHLGGHIFHLGVDDADGFFVDGFGGGLDGGVAVVDGLVDDVSSESHGSGKVERLTVQSFFMRDLSESLDLRTSSIKRLSF